MPAQQGTLNLVGESVFEVVALPVSAFVGVDDDGDGRLSDAEVSAHEEQLTKEISRGYRLGEELQQFSFPDGLHSEASWAGRIHLPFQFFFGRAWRAQRGES